VRPTLYFDECFDHGAINPLRRRSFTVTSAQEQGTIGLDDEAQLTFAASRNLVLVAHNARDFKRWHRRFRDANRSHGGIIVVPQNRRGRGEAAVRQLVIRVAMLADRLATLPPTQDRLLIWGAMQARLEAGYRPPGYSEEECRIALGRSR